MRTWIFPADPRPFLMGQELAGIFAIESASNGMGGVIRFRGRLLMEPEAAMSLLNERLWPYGYVPVLRDADRMGLIEIDREIRRLVARSRAGELGPSDVSEGTFNVTNLGMYGIDELSPVIAPGQVGILAVGRIRKAADVDLQGRVAVRSLCVLTGAFDHRVINGAQAALFMAALRDGFQMPGGREDA